MIGLDISDRSLKIVQVSDRKDSKLQSVCWSSLDANLMRRGVILDPVKVIEVVTAAMSSCAPVPITDRNVVVSIPERQSFVRVVEIPSMKAAEMTEAVQWAVRQHIPFDLDSVYLDWQPLISTQSQATRQQVLVGAAQREVVDPLLSVIDALGLNLVALELESQAIVRSLLPRDSLDVTGVLIIDLGATMTNIILYDRGAMRFTTSLNRGGDYLTERLAQTLHLEPSIAAERKAMIGAVGYGADDEIATTLRSAAQDLVQQIYNIVNPVVNEVAGSKELKTILLAGGAANLPGLIDIFAAVFPGVPVQIGNPFINLSIGEEKDVPILSAADASHFTTAIGLALRSLADSL